MKFATLFLVTFTLSSFSYALDSTHVKPLIPIPLKPKTTINTRVCHETPELAVHFLLHSGTTGFPKGSWITTACNEGYQPIAFETNVNMYVGNGVYKWRYFCCKTEVKYVR